LKRATKKKGQGGKKKKWLQLPAVTTIKMSLL